MASIRANLVANYVGQGWTALMTLGFIPLYIRYLGIENYGLIGAFTIVLNAAMLFDAGMTPTLNRELARFVVGERDAASAVDLVRSIETIYLAVVIGLVIVAGVAAPQIVRYALVAHAISADTMTKIVFLMVVAAMLRVGEGVYRGALLGLGQPVHMNAVVAAGATLRSAGAVGALAFAPTIETFFLWQVFASLVNVGALAVVTHMKLPRIGRRARFDRAVVSEVRRFASGILVTTGLALLLTQVDKILLVRLLPLAEFGYYSLAATLAAGLYQLIGPVTQSYYPRLSALAARGTITDLAAAYHQGATLTTLVAAPLAFSLIVLARPLLLVWTGNAEIAAHTATLLRLLAFGTFLHSLMYMPYMLQLAKGWPGLAVRVNSVAVLIFVPCLLFIVPRYKAQGAAVTWIALNTGYVVYTVRRMHRQLLPGEALRWYLKDVSRPTLAAAVAALALSAFPWQSTDRSRIIAELAFAVPFVALACLAASDIARPSLNRSLAQLRRIV